ncbi:hypothetical protein WDW89_00870 [Deltaproteobacteria bacterium TL4]
MENEKIDPSLLEVWEWKRQANQDCERLGGLKAQAFLDYQDQKSDEIIKRYHLNLVRVTTVEKAKTS